MNEPKHTPGKWEVAHIPQNEGEKRRFVIVGPLPTRLILADVWGTDAEGLANAHLLAAAPELYAACKAAQKSLLGFCQSLAGVTDLSADVDALNQLEAAIAEAEKETL